MSTRPKSNASKTTDHNNNATKVVDEGDDNEKHKVFVVSDTDDYYFDNDPSCFDEFDLEYETNDGFLHDDTRLHTAVNNGKISKIEIKHETTKSDVKDKKKIPRPVIEFSDEQTFGRMFEKIDSQAAMRYIYNDFKLFNKYLKEGDPYLKDLNLSLEEIPKEYMSEDDDCISSISSEGLKQRTSTEIGVKEKETEIKNSNEINNNNPTVEKNVSNLSDFFQDLKINQDDQSDRSQKEEDIKIIAGLDKRAKEAISRLIGDKFALSNLSPLKPQNESLSNGQHPNCLAQEENFTNNSCSISSNNFDFGSNGYSNAMSHVYPNYSAAYSPSSNSNGSNVFYNSPPPVYLNASINTNYNKLYGVQKPYAKLASYDYNEHQKYLQDKCRMKMPPNQWSQAHRNYISEKYDNLKNKIDLMANQYPKGNQYSHMQESIHAQHQLIVSNNHMPMHKPIQNMRSSTSSSMSTHQIYPSNIRHQN